MRYFRAGQVIFTVSLCIACSGPSLANTLSLNLSTPAQIVNPRGSAIWAGTISNNSLVVLTTTDLFLDFSGFDSSALGIEQLLGDPALSILPHTTSRMLDLFSVTVRSEAVIGLTYPIDSVVLQDVFGHQSDAVSVAVTVTQLPEVPTAPLLGTGLLMFLATKRRALARLCRATELKVQNDSD